MQPVTHRKHRAFHAQAAGGLAGATARGEAARVQWVKEGLIVPGEPLAQAWGLTRQALAPAANRGEVFAVKVGDRLQFPRDFLGMDRQTVAAICRTLGHLGASEKPMFWLVRISANVTGDFGSVTASEPMLCCAGQIV